MRQYQNETKSSTPSFSEFDPTIIPYQIEVIDDLFGNFDYAKGAHELLLSGSVGSAKSILMAHIAIRHCLEYPRARVLLGRRAKPDLRATIFNKIIEHLEGSLYEETHYIVNRTTLTITFRNGSEIISRSWADKNYKKIRSLELSGAIIEELTENDDEDKEAYDEIIMRVGRLSHIKQSFVVSATNPDSPGHWVYKYFMESDSINRHVYYSVTTNNPFLPSSYIDKLKKDMDPRQAQRMIYGKWLEISQDVLYYAYDKQFNYIDKSYEVDLKYPVHISWDFNIGEGKPLSCCLVQYINDTFHIFNEVVIEGIRTESSCDELASRGLLDYKTTYIINGDASGKNRDTRNIKSDYDIIKNYLSNYKTKDGRPLVFQLQVPLSNPAIRKRHNLVNGYCKNALGQHRLFIYKDAPTCDKGVRLTQLKKGGQYIEDDSKDYQHITTAIGYSLCQSVLENSRIKASSTQL